MCAAPLRRGVTVLVSGTLEITGVTRGQLVQSGYPDTAGGALAAIAAALQQHMAAAGVGVGSLCEPGQEGAVSCVGDVVVVGVEDVPSLAPTGDGSSAPSLSGGARRAQGGVGAGGVVVSYVVLVGRSAAIAQAVVTALRCVGQCTQHCFCKRCA